MLRFKLEDLPPRLREQAVRQLSPSSPAKRPEDNGQKTEDAGRAAGHRRVRPPITMTKKSEQSSAESRFNAEFLDGRGKFEAITLHLPGGSKYTADFFIADWPFYPDPVLIEVKGSYRLQSHARAATAFKTACACYPEFAFCWAEQQKDGNRWKVTFFQDGKQLGDCEEGTADEILHRNTGRNTETD